MNRARLLLPIALALLLLAGPVQADQYRTQIREVPKSQAKQPTEKDLENQLDELNDNPYAKAMTLQHLAGLAADKGNLDKARNYLQQAIDLNALSEPAMEEMRGNLAQLYAAEGDQRKVIETLQPLLKKGVPADAIDSRAWLALGNAYANQGQWDKAVEPLQRASAGAGSRDEALYRLQLAVYMHAKRYDAAAKALHELVKLAPHNKTYFLQLAAVESKRGKHGEAVAALEIAQRRGMLDSPEARLQLIRAYLASGAPYDAASQLQAWMEQGQIPKNAANWRLLASAWTEADETERAIDPLRRAAQATGDAKLYAQLGQLQMDLAQWDAAADAFGHALAHGGAGQAGELLLSQGLAYYQQSKMGLAHQAFERAEGHSSVAKLARQWVKFLDAKPANLQPLAMKGLAGRGGGETGGETPAGTPLAGGSGGGTAPAGTGAQALPAGVPETGDRYTPVGAVRAGNADGSIPAWTGGITPDRAPGDFESGGRIVNPFPNEKPLFTITRDNLDQYKDLLTAGHRALFARYPDYRMPVYPSHRTAAYPKSIYRATLANQKRAHLKDPDSLVGARLGYPFRRPETGVEVMWNHRLRYRSNDIWVRSDEAVVDDDGIAKTQRRVEEVLFGYGNLNKPAGMGENILAYYMMSLNQNGRRGGTVLVHETMDKRRGPRRIWVAVPGTGRLFRVPPVGYDNPRPSTDGLMFIDQIDMYNGAFDHYVWRLVGRREMIVPYNAYRLQDTDLSYEQILQPHYPARGPMRYERHRVWIVEATTRAGEHNQFGKRVFYVDEDSWSILMVDCYDDQGNLWRFQEGHAVQYYDLQLTYTGPVFIYDLKGGRYFATRLTNQAPGAYYNTGRYEPVDFRPAAVRRKIR